MFDSTGTPKRRNKPYAGEIDWTEADAAFERQKEMRDAYYTACTDRGKAWGVLRQMGVSIRQIAEHFGISYEQVQKSSTRVKDAA